MDLTLTKTVKNLLEKYQIKPSRGLGQNFLINKEVIRNIIGAAELGQNDAVLEIGPGLGVLTQELAKIAKKVVAVEKDQRMIKILEETLGDYKNVDIIHGDILKIPNCQLPVTDYKLIGNLPFYLTAPVIRQFLELAETRRPLKSPRMTLVVQKEVAQRICPARGQSDAKQPRLNLLAVSVQFYAEPKIISYISKGSFWPSPEVDAAILKITPYPFINTANTAGNIVIAKKVETSLFFKIVKAGFSQPRKQLINNLSVKLKAGKEEIGEWLLENGLQPDQRAETLGVGDWINLAKNCKIKI